MLAHMSLPIEGRHVAFTPWTWAVELRHNLHILE
jgi:hypothetical protein